MTFSFEDAPIFAAVITVIASVAISQTFKLNRKFMLLQAKVNFLYEKTGIAFDPFPGLPPAIQTAMAEGKTIEAIKLYRQATGKGLRESKDAIERLMR